VEAGDKTSTEGIWNLNLFDRKTARPATITLLAMAIIITHNHLFLIFYSQSTCPLPATLPCRNNNLKS
jgi:hypothetical protein